MNRRARTQSLARIGADGQARISDSTVLIVGVGGIGCAAASYLTCAGVGHLLLCDFDTIDETNLGRQFLYGPADVGEYKAVRAASKLAAMNPDVRLTEIPQQLSDAAMTEAVDQADIVLDGTDNFRTRFQINAAAVRRHKRLVSGAAIRFEGQVVTFGPDYSRSPCYRCLYQEADESLEDCAGNGVLGPIPGLVGCLMAAETLKSLAHIDVNVGKLQLYDGLSADWRQVWVRKRQRCPICA